VKLLLLLAPDGSENDAGVQFATVTESL